MKVTYRYAKEKGKCHICGKFYKPGTKLVIIYSKQLIHYECPDDKDTYKPRKGFLDKKVQNRVFG